MRDPEEAPEADQPAVPLPAVSLAEVLLPESARQAVVRLASEVLDDLTPEQVPPGLRTAARFSPSKRVRLAGGSLAAALDGDHAFRLLVAEAAREVEPELAAALLAGRPPAAADPVAVAAVAYLLRPEGWQDMLRGSVAALDAQGQKMRAAAEGHAHDRLREQLDRLRRARRDDAERNRVELTAAREERDLARRRAKELATELRVAEGAVRSATEEVGRLRQNRGHEVVSLQGEVRRLRQRLAEAEDAVETVRRAERGARGVADTRLWLLVETLNGAAAGLRRELALPPPADRPGDLLVTPAGNDVAPAPSVRGDDPALFDRLLALPQVHLLIDGYNVTMSGYGELPLHDQRTRLLGGLGVLAAQTGAEVTCVFDGAERPTLLPQVPRGVRVLYSAPGQTADELIRRLVGVEPPGRPVVVVSTDREVADGIRAHGAHPVLSTVLLRRLARG